MLSRVAERVYWLARYMERVENTARLARVHSQLMFDLPKSVKLNWYSLVEITSNEAYFDQYYDARTEQNCMTMLLSDRDNPASLISSLWWARENTRTTRDILPREAWIHINELYLLVKDNQADFQVRSKRNLLLEKIIRSCQAWSGMLSSTMSQNETYRFIKLGMSIERADMTSRILDVGGLFVAQETTVDHEYPYEGILWANLLKSISAHFMYRQNVQTEINGQQVVDFLIHDKEFARSIRYCVSVMRGMASKLPNGEEMGDAIESFLKYIDENNFYEVGSTALHDYLDEIQLQLSSIHTKFYDVWFNPKAVA
ncbi:alpha-E domain-containing protein [Thiomicrorhabdus sp. ZW0627]|uniref:alpha-E domain-containing protein n=1 Tax=Thiomicrorhabdus sp. ZW0627 TaxID=3039774 RepID=UPI0024369E4A|nr:alpha-E domain-containing protein [Thiomicrorhabdus sp. ZW0627]MDG6774722.1 alpha-E domain-containing protein [Thiomicrorhabdus sp. ZW0627]